MIFQFLRVGVGVAEVFKVFAQARVPQLPHRVDCLTMQMKEFKGFFALFPGPKRVPR